MGTAHQLRNIGGQQFAVFRRHAHSIRHETQSNARAKLGVVLLMTAMGVPMLWMGEEFGEYKRKSKTVTQPNKISWSLLEQDQNQDLFEYYKKLIALRKQNPALQSDNIEFFHEDADAKVETRLIASSIRSLA